MKKNLLKSLPNKRTLGFLTVLVCLLLTNISFGQSTKTWYTPTDYEPQATGLFGTSGGTATVTTAAGTFRTGTSAIGLLPGSTSAKYYWNSNIGIIPGVTTGYVHLIYWAKGYAGSATSESSLASFRYTTAGKTGTGSSGVTGTAVTLSTTAWTQCQLSYAVNNATRVYFAAPQCQLKGSSTASGCYFDDFIVYYDSIATTDTTAPASGPSNVSYDGSTLSWTNGIDAGTGVQGSIVLGTNTPNATTPTVGMNILQQGYYPAGTTIASADSTTTWTVLADDTSATSYATTGYTTYAVFNYDKAYNYSSVTINGPLPVALKSFNGSLVNSYATLAWATAVEINTKAFGIEKSIDGKSFASIGEVAAKNRPSSYTFSDPTKVEGLQYYRLKITNNDGSYSYSSTVALNNNASFKLGVYPNPVFNTAIIAHQQAGAGAILKISSIDGKTLVIYPVQTGATETSVDVSRLGKGSYIVSFENSSTRTVAQFVK